MYAMRRISKKVLMIALLSFAIGVLWVFVVRFSLIRKNDTHSHANFALYVNAERDEFKSFTFYEEVAACNLQGDPKALAHMHDNINHVVHVHQETVTWGQFFSNLGYTLGNNVLATDSGVFSDTELKKLNFKLNGSNVEDVANRVIKSEDVLLVDYGQTTDEQLQQHYDAITKDAAEYNKRQDPSACTGSKPFTLKERLTKTFNIAD